MRKNPFKKHIHVQSNINVAEPLSNTTDPTLDALKRELSNAAIKPVKNIKVNYIKFNN